MQHSICKDGFRFRLRPAVLSDSEFIVELRADPDRNAFIHPIKGGVESQRAWFASYETREGDYYFIIEDRVTGEPHGTVAVYDIDASRMEGEWGRWVLKPGSMAATESVWLTYRVAFEDLSMRRLYCRTVADNAKVVSFHDSCGLKRARELPDHFVLGGASYGAVEHELLPQDWADVGARLSRMAERLAQRLAK